MLNLATYLREWNEVSGCVFGEKQLDTVTVTPGLGYDPKRPNGVDNNYILRTELRDISYDFDHSGLALPLLKIETQLSPLLDNGQTMATVNLQCQVNRL